MDALTHFGQAHAALPSTGTWLDGLRAEGLAALTQSGFPGRRNEAWKYTNASRILGTPWETASGKAAVLPAGTLTGPHTVVLVDGRIDPALSTLQSLPDGVTLRAIEESDEVGAALGPAAGFEALNTAFFAGGATLSVAPGTRLTQPIHVVHLATGGGTHAAARLLISAGRLSELTVVSHWVGQGASLTTGVTELVLAEGAQVRHIRVHQGASDAQHVGTVAAVLADNAVLHSHLVSLGGDLCRVDLRARLVGPGAEARLWGLALGRAKEHCDFHTQVLHEQPHTTSFEHYKAILDDRARGVFTGHIVVAKDAQKIASSQSNDNLLLSDKAIANTRPQLEIYADDVQCAHGATIGRLDADATFYLRQRGLSADEAKGLLTFAFANEVLASIPDADVRAALEAQVKAWLDAR